MKSNEMAERFTRSLMVFDELSQTILKGHLLLEEELSMILDSTIGGPDIISEAKLTFFQKLKLVQAAFCDEISPETWGAIEKLNSLRNQMAHQVESPRIPKLISEIVTILKLKIEDHVSIASTRECQIELVAMSLILTYNDLIKLKERLPAKFA